MDITIDRHDILVGFFVLTGLVVLIVLTLFLAGPDLLDLGSVRLKTYLDSTFGLTRGVPVTYLDTEVGQVKSVNMEKGDAGEVRVEVVFTVKEKYREYIRKDFETNLEKQLFGGIVSGRIMLQPPPMGRGIADAGPVEDGDVLDASENLKNLSRQDELTELPKQVRPILDELHTFLESLNDPQGDFRVALTQLRTLSEYLAEPEGDLKRTLTQTNELAARMLDRQNLLMGLLQDQGLLTAIEETVENMRTTSRKAAGLAQDAERMLDAAGEASSTGRDLLMDARPQVERILENILELQEEVAALADDARFISSSLVESSAVLPKMIRDAELRLNELEDITRAVKNIFFIRWTLEDESIEDPVIQKPLLLHDFNKRPGAEEKKEK